MTGSWHSKAQVVLKLLKYSFLWSMVCKTCSIQLQKRYVYFNYWIHLMLFHLSAVLLYTVYNTVYAPLYGLLLGLKSLTWLSGFLLQKLRITLKENSWTLYEQWTQHITSHIITAMLDIMNPPSKYLTTYFTHLIKIEQKLHITHIRKINER